MAGSLTCFHGVHQRVAHPDCVGVAEQDSVVVVADLAVKRYQPAASLDGVRRSACCGDTCLHRNRALAGVAVVYGLASSSLASMCLSSCASPWVMASASPLSLTIVQPRARRCAMTPISLSPLMAMPEPVKEGNDGSGHRQLI